ncbi:basic helix-loop-helix (bHLH) DNA-binding family protein [Thalictrum thalictroides]|uniref:Basic helix-loop-helix (BHLH) DNA-binding family protein n=1 Tax=Thalictrum thalictroides TaxID=46969 RepID=A0A7J6W1M6_THATH|nr:basic helix-loop-helix (bHLH) DNA-binding family protein [Thalictrum thalictroides]
MDAIFFLDQESRALFVRSLAQTVRCTYICLWSYVPLLNDCLLSIDGWYNDDTNQPSSSTGSLAYRLFNAYRQTQHNINTGFVPGLAFKENIPYLELNDLDLLRRTANVSQQQFYQGAWIKSAAFLSCRSGEIEIGMSTTLPVNLKMEIINWLQQSQLQELISPQADHNWPSSSSSSLLSSPDSSSLPFNVPSSTSYVPEFLKDAQFEQAIRPTSTPVLPLELQTMEAYNRLRIQNLNPESVNAAMTRAMLAVISSPSSSSSSHQPQQTIAYGTSHVSHKTGAFKDYTPGLSQTIPFQANPTKQNMLKRSISMMRKIDLSWRQELEQGIPPTSSQLHHKLSERKRREKLNESFLELRSLLPPGSKKDKASVLSNALEYLSNLKTEVLELKQKNDQLILLEARKKKLHVRGPGEELDQTGSSSERIDVQIIRTSESTSEEQEIILRVTVQGDCNMEDLIINILGFFKLVNEVSLVSMNADTELLQTTSINQVIFRLRIKGGEWDEAAFKEAVTRIVADVAK